MSIHEFLENLEQRQLVSQNILRQVREKIAKGDRKITARSLLKYLVKKDLISRSQAKQLLETTLTVSPAAESSILGMVSLPEMGEQEPKKRVNKLTQQEEIPTLAPVDSGGASITREARQAVEREDELASTSGLVSESLSAGAVEFSAAADLETAKKKRKKRGKQNEFDSPLLLFGGGGLLVLILAGGIIGYLLSREDADAILAEAGEFYDGGSYTQAIKQYDRFIENFPRHPEFSAAKVKLGLAKIWNATNSTTQYSGALKVTKEVLDRIEDEKEFGTAKRDLASRLPAIARGLALQAEKATDPEEIARFVAESKEALAMCNNTKFVPTTYRDEIVINEILETLDRVERRQDQKVKLAQALTDIQEAIDARDTAKGYAIHNELIKENPRLLSNTSLTEKVKEISTAEQAVVQYVAESRTAESSPRSTPLIAELALAARRGPTANVKGIVAVRVDGAVYALNASDGKLLWRKFVGLGPNLPVVTLPDGDLLVVDARHHDLLRLNATDGRLHWRQSFEGPISVPLVAEGRLFVAEVSGKLHVLESASGECTGFVEFGQPLPVPPVLSPQGHRIYVVGQHSSIYTLSADDFQCLGVYFLGHAATSLAVPPTPVLDKLAVAENSGLESSTLHILATDKDGVIASEDASQRLEGLVNTPLMVEGRRLVALTSKGQVAVYEIGSGDSSEVLTQIALRDPESRPPVARFGLLHDGHVWSAGTQLSKLVIMPTGNRLQVRNIDRDYSDDAFNYPLQIIGDVVFHLRHPAKHAGAIVGAMNLSSGQAYWETELAVPLAGAPSVDPSGPRIGAITASGSAYLLDRQTMSDRVQDQAQKLTSGPKLPPLAESVDLGSGRLALASPGEEFLLHFRPDSPRGPLSVVKLPGAISCPPQVWNNTFVAPTTVGQVYLYDADSAQQIGSPFQPPLTVGTRYHWLTPAVYGKDEHSRLVISDGVANVYLLKRSTEPQFHLQVEAERNIGESPLTTRLAVAGDAVFAGDENGQLARFTLPDLEREAPTTLGSRIVWGPFTIGEQILFATVDDELVCVDNQGEITWRHPLDHGQPAGKPLFDGDGVFLLWQQGALSRLDTEDGSQLGHVELEQPTVAGPIAFGDRLLVASADGALLVVNRP